MRLVLVCLFAVVSLACGEDYVEPNAFNYHQEVGIKEAERIRNEEMQILSKQAESRIVGGSMTNPYIHPHLGGLIIDLVGVVGNSVCGSSLLTANRLVTAAHCWNDGRNQAWRFTVVLGSQFLFTGGSGLRVPTSEVHMHPQWWPATLTNDVAMIYLPYSIPFSSQISPISLPTGTMLWEDFNGHMALAQGYGKTHDDIPLSTTNTMTHQVNKQVITNAMCSLSYGSAVIQPSTMCTSGSSGASICGGDSGGSLVLKRNEVYFLIGVNSFVAASGCQQGHPSGFARVTSFFNFIQSHL